MVTQSKSVIQRDKTAEMHIFSWVDKKSSGRQCKPPFGSFLLPLVMLTFNVLEVRFWRIPNRDNLHWNPCSKETEGHHKLFCDTLVPSQLHSKNCTLAVFFMDFRWADGNERITILCDFYVTGFYMRCVVTGYQLVE